MQEISEFICVEQQDDEVLARVLQEEEDWRYAQTTIQTSAHRVQFWRELDTYDETWSADLYLSRSRKSYVHRQKASICRAKVVTQLTANSPSISLPSIVKSHPLTTHMIDLLPATGVCPYSATQLEQMKKEISPPSKIKKIPEKTKPPLRDEIAPMVRAQRDPTLKARLLRKRRWISRSANQLSKKMAVRYCQPLIELWKKDFITPRHRRSKQPTKRKPPRDGAAEIAKEMQKDLLSSLDVFGASLLFKHYQSLKSKAPGLQSLSCIPIDGDVSTRFLQRMNELRISPILSFHGTAEQNYYSICEKGLLVGGEGIKVRNGSAYGQGVYTGETYTVSQGYGPCVFVCATLLTEATKRGPNMLISPDRTCVLPIWRVNK